MAVREPKSTQHTTISITGRDGTRKGKLELSSGNISYFRKNAPKVTLKITYQRMAELLEDEVAYQALDAKAPLPKGSKSDFDIEVYEHENAKDVDTAFDMAALVTTGSCGLSKMDPRRVEDGAYNVTSQYAGAPKRKFSWYANISIPMAISVIGWYIDKFLAGKRSRKNSTEIVVTKEQMRRALLQLIKRLDD